MPNRLNRIVLVLILALGGIAHAKDKPDPSVPTPEAQALIAQVKDAYAKLRSLTLAGKLAADMDVGGKTDARDTSFTASYASPTQFRHEVKNEILAGSTGQKLYVYEIRSDRYLTADAPKEKESYRQLPGIIGQVLDVQDPSLLLAISANSLSDLIGPDAKLIHLADSTMLDGQSLPTLAFTAGDGREIHLSFDPKSHLLRQATYDLGAMLRDRGAEQVKQALITVKYTDIQPDAAIADGAFAWSAPASARELSQTGDPMANLEGRPAPDFTLTTLDGQKVKLSDLKGSTVLLDFWATWCPPCVHALPEINAIYNANKGQGTIKVFALNVGEDKDTVKKFLDSKKLNLPVLLDTEEEVSGLYGIRGIPTTIVIRPDGVVAKVFVGMPQGGKAEIERELTSASAK